MPLQYNGKLFEFTLKITISQKPDVGFTVLTSKFLVGFIYCPMTMDDHHY